MASTTVPAAAKQWIHELELLTGNTFIAREPLAGDQLEREVDDALDALYGHEWDRGWERVAVALRALYAHADCPLMIRIARSDTRLKATPRAREIQAETGCDIDEALRRADREDLAVYGVPRHIANGARAWCEVLAELHPVHEFVPAYAALSTADGERGVAAAE